MFSVIQRKKIIYLLNSLACLKYLSIRGTTRFLVWYTHNTRSLLLLSIMQKLSCTFLSELRLFVRCARTRKPIHSILFWFSKAYFRISGWNFFRIQDYILLLLHIFSPTLGVTASLLPFLVALIPLYNHQGKVWFFNWQKL